MRIELAYASIFSQNFLSNLTSDPVEYSGEKLQCIAMSYRLHVFIREAREAVDAFLGVFHEIGWEVWDCAYKVSQM